MCLWMFYESNWAEESSFFDRQSLFRGIKIQQKVIDFWGIYALWKINQTFLHDRYDYPCCVRATTQTLTEECLHCRGHWSFQGSFENYREWVSSFILSPLSFHCIFPSAAWYPACNKTNSNILSIQVRPETLSPLQQLIILELQPESISRIHRG